jgi:hypothetical protein
MTSDSAVAPISKAQLWTGRVISTLLVLLLLLDGIMKLFKPVQVTMAFSHLGFPESTIIPIGALLIVCAILYAIPQTAILGAILLTGYLGGAVVCHVRIGDPLFSHILVPVYIGILLWAGVYARDLRLRALIPFRR